MAEPTPWQREIHRVLKAYDVKQVAYVPDAGHAGLIDLCAADNQMKTVVLSTEEEGVALLAGAWLGGERGVLLMQSSGVGNCINMLSLSRTCGLPLLMLVTMRGEWKEFNPWQISMGQGTAPVLQQSGSLMFRIDDAADTADVVDGACRMVFEGCTIGTVQIGQRMIGAKSFGR